MSEMHEKTVEKINLLDIQTSEIEFVRAHQFDYGLKRAVNQLSSTIILRDEGYELVYQPSKLKDEVWYGDCAADVLLSAKALQNGERTIEKQSFYFPETNFSCTHYKLIFRVDGDGHSFYYPIDHSIFYRSLNPMFVTEAVDTNFSDFENTELINSIFLNSYTNYEEFLVDKNPALLAIAVHRYSEAVQVSVCIFVQNGSGNVTSRYELRLSFSDEEINNIQHTELLHKFSQVFLTKTGKGEFVQFEDGIIKSKMIEAFASVLAALGRGKTTQ